MSETFQTQRIEHAFLEPESTLAVPTLAEAACYVEYKAKQDNPLRLHYGVLAIDGDCPDAGQSVSRRRQSTTPIQALNLFNSRFIIDESNAFAARIETEAGSKAVSPVKRTTSRPNQGFPCSPQLPMLPIWPATGGL